MATKRTTRWAFLRMMTVLPALFVATHASADASEMAEGNAAFGRATYRVYCASCHGTSGQGDGSVAEHLRVAPSDLTRIAERNGGEFPTEQVHEIIDGRTLLRGHGSKDMPVWGDAFLMTAGNENEDAVRAKIRDVTSYLASIQVEQQDAEPSASDR